MDESSEQFGSLSIVTKIALLAQWAPMLAKLEAVSTAKTPQEKAIALVNALKLAAEKTKTAKDNDVLGLIEAVLVTPEGVALVNWFAIVSEEIK